MPPVGVGAAVVVRGRESRPQGEGRQSVGKVAAHVTGCQHGGTVAMNVGEMQRLLSVKAEREPGHRFGDLFGLLCDEDWLRLAHDHVARNAGRKTAGCDGVVMADFDEDLEGNLRRLAGSLQSGTFEACPVRRVNIPKPNGRVRPLGIPMRHSYCTSLQRGWGLSRERPALPWTCLNQEAERRVQERRAGLRKRAMVSGVNRIHHGPWDVDWRPSTTPDWHQSAIVETVTFSKPAATLAEQRPSAR
jgi:hypothetical protein